MKAEVLSRRLPQLLELLKAAFAERSAGAKAPALDAALGELIVGAGPLSLDQSGHLVVCFLFEACAPGERVALVTTALTGHVLTLSLHTHGCRVVQRCLEHCTLETEREALLGSLASDAVQLAPDQYGNYVMQHILEKGPAQWRCVLVLLLPLAAAAAVFVCVCVC